MMLCCAVMAQPDAASAKQISVVVPLCPFDQEAALKIEDLLGLSSSSQLDVSLNALSHSGTYLEQSVSSVKTKIPAKSHRLECFCNPL